MALRQTILRTTAIEYDDAKHEKVYSRDKDGNLFIIKLYNIQVTPKVLDVEMYVASGVIEMSIVLAPTSITLTKGVTVYKIS